MFQSQKEEREREADCPARGGGIDSATAKNGVPDFAYARRAASLAQQRYSIATKCSRTPGECTIVRDRRKIDASRQTNVNKSGLGVAKYSSK